ncbi:NADH-quinone oxidoreductase subunit N [Barnesiella sp. An55]|uniref:NADH-quinone oxidoreductase subunit N n=1 Tax=Barnesiella sp. An55 TaxID=1965646 RepID=UPI000B382A86|nr:NADH-quinone oxidoreductase subunit N [Barnesiella sp. An55]OUN72653.1 NADH-quinone oxidoreductase subunit N [Barnesiella sp. An55]HIZ26672.1 NADH-quinone oxidoreductase subunit N [Candidatus Barnesiella merdipullorum]
MDYSQFLVMRSEISLLVVFLLIFLIDTFGGQKSLKGLSITACVLFALHTVWNIIPVESASAFGGMYHTSPMASMVKTVLNIGTFIVLLQSISWSATPDVKLRRGEFYELLLVTLFGMYLMVSSGHFLLFFIGLETASLPMAALIAITKKDSESYEAGAKYLFTAVFSSALFLLGLSFLYGVAGSLYFDDIATSVAANSTPLFIATLVFVLAGMGFKLSLVPFHLWTADVYEGAPTQVTSYLSVISKGSAAFALMLVLYKVFAFEPAVWQGIMWALIVLTITVGNLFAIRQKNLKRFLAFSSISQAGYIMLGIVADSIQGTTALVYYVLVYIFSNLAAFGVISSIEHNTGKVSMDDYNGLYKTNPKLSVIMMLAMFSLAGIPPFAGFFSKFFIFASAIHSGFYILVLIALLNTIISLYYYLLVVKAMFINTENECVIAPFRSDNGSRVSLVVCVAGILLLGIASCVYGYFADLSVLGI